MKNNSETLPVLYILMRNDLDSMNPGKAMAQASHASNAFIHEVTENAFNVQEWQECTDQGFGTVLVLGGSMKDIAETISEAKEAEYIAGVVHDPTYPILDGAVCHHIPLDTCAYMFVRDKLSDERASKMLFKYSLHA